MAAESECAVPARSRTRGDPERSTYASFVALARCRQADLPGPLGALINKRHSLTQLFAFLLERVELFDDLIFL